VRRAARRLISAAVLGGMLVVGGVTMPGSAAQAAPTGCKEQYLGATGYRAQCGSLYPYDEYRAKLWCYHISTGALQIKFGPWRTTGASSTIWSSATCGYPYESGTGLVEGRDV
jgi:hypothetical protein